MSNQPIEALLDEVDALQKKAVDLPYFVGSDTAEDCPDHRNSGLALVDTGRSGDWPVARLCEWPTAKFIAEAANAYPRLSRELRQREQQADAAQDRIAMLAEGYKHRAEAAEKALRQRIEREQFLEELNEKKNAEIESLYLQLEQQQQSEVEAALGQLQVMFPNERVFIDVEANNYGASVISYAKILIAGKCRIEEPTLSEAMQKVRKWKEESK